MEPLSFTLHSLHNMQERIDYVEKLVAEDPDELEAWLYIADHYLDVDYEKTLNAWQQIARLRPHDETVQEALRSLSEVNGEY